MGYALPYNESFEIEIKRGMIVAPGPNGRTETIRLRQRVRRRQHEYALGNPQSLQQQLTDRAVLILQRKRATVEAEAAVKLRQVIDGTVDHIFALETRAYDEVTVAWITYAYNRIEYLVVQMVRETRYITVQTIEDILRRLCPLPPIC